MRVEVQALFEDETLCIMLPSNRHLYFFKICKRIVQTNHIIFCDIVFVLISGIVRICMIRYARKLSILVMSLPSFCFTDQLEPLTNPQSICTYVLAYRSQFLCIIVILLVFRNCLYLAFNIYFS